MKELYKSKNKLEWVVFFFSFLLVLFLIGYLIYHSISFNNDNATPEISVAYKKDASDQSPHRYLLLIKNNGSITAEEVKIEASLYKEGSSIEKAELQLAFSPKWSEREGWINFSHDPAAADSLTVRVVSYKKP